MAIKVKHEGNVASRVVSSAAGGAAKRAMDAAAFAKGREIQQKQAASAHASAPHASAPLISAPSSAGGAVGGAAHAGLIGGGGGIGAQGGSRIGTPWERVRNRDGGATAYSRGSGVSDNGLVKVTGSSQFDRPDDASQWNPNTQRWEREYLPGEYEAEARDRIMGAEYGWKQSALDEEAARAKVAADEAQARRNAEYTFKQKADWAALEQAYQDAASSGRYTPQELETLRQQVDLQKANIKGNPFEALEPKQTAQQDIESRLVTVNGQQMYRNAKGDLELIPSATPTDNGFGDFVKMFPKMTKTVMQKQQDEKGRWVDVPVQVQMSPEEAVSAWNNMKAAWDGAGAHTEQETTSRPLYGPRATPVPDYYKDLKEMNPFIGLPSSPQAAAMQAAATGGDPVMAARQAATPVPDYYKDLKEMNPFIGLPSSPQAAAMQAAATGGDPVMAARQAATPVPDYYKDLKEMNPFIGLPSSPTTNAVQQAQTPTPTPDAPSAEAPVEAPAESPEEKWAHRVRND